MSRARHTEEATQEEAQIRLQLFRRKRDAIAAIEKLDCIEQADTIEAIHNVLRMATRVRR